MNKVFAYARVSSKKQETYAQEHIIKQYAEHNKLEIVRWFKESRTAAKVGRPEFTEMMKCLSRKRSDVSGVIIHKIDRGSRNLHDWAAIGDLIDNDIEVYFAHESLNLKERGGRLSADIQAVMAADYVRNLRQEAIKGLYARLEQGIYPFRAPIGYLDNGRGKLKTPDPKVASLIQEVFRLYTEEGFGSMSLVDEMYNRGLRNLAGGKVTLNGILTILKNPFYKGGILIKGQYFEGKHEPIVSLRTFEKAGKIMQGRTNSKVQRHDFLFRKRIRCENCHLRLIGEVQKGRHYYRCHTKNCPTKTIKESDIEFHVTNILKMVRLSEKEISLMKKSLSLENSNAERHRSDKIKLINIQVGKVKSKLDRLMDLYLEGNLDKDMFERKKKELLLEKEKLIDKKEKNSSDCVINSRDIERFLELVKRPIFYYKNANKEEKRMFLEFVTSNLSINMKKVSFTLSFPNDYLVNRDNLEKCEDKQRIPRTPVVISFTNALVSPIIPRSMDEETIENFSKRLFEHFLELPEIKLPKLYEIKTDNAAAK